MSENKIPIFCYHGIGDQRKYDVEKENFSEQIEWLNENYNLLTVSEIFEKKREGRLPEKAAALTFDDGLKSSFEARNILKENEIKATFYIVSGILGELWEGEKVIDEDEIKKLSEEGHEIGAHTVSHPFLTELKKENIKREIVDSKRRLEEITGENIKTLAYPYGDFNSRVKSEVEDTGIDTALTTKPRTLKNFQQPLETPRFTVLKGHRLKNVKMMSRGRNLFYQNYWNVALQEIVSKIK